MKTKLATVIQASIQIAVLFLTKKHKVRPLNQVTYINRFSVMKQHNMIQFAVVQ